MSKEEPTSRSQRTVDWQGLPREKDWDYSRTFSLQRGDNPIRVLGLLRILSAGYPLTLPLSELGCSVFCPFAPPRTGLCIVAGGGDFSSLGHRSVDHVSQPHAPEEKTAEPPTEVWDLEMDSA